MTRTKLLQSTILDLPPSCIEEVPRCSDYFIVGTYRLKDNETNSNRPELLRDGSVIACRLVEDNV